MNLFLQVCYGILVIVFSPGELTGIEYLLKQTGQPLQDMTTDIEGPDIDDVESTDDLRTHTRKTYTTLNMVAS